MTTWPFFFFVLSSLAIVWELRNIKSTLVELLVSLDDQQVQLPFVYQYFKDIESSNLNIALIKLADLNAQIITFERTSMGTFTIFAKVPC